MTESERFLDSRHHDVCPAERALRGLEADGVEYRLSVRGRSLIPVLNCLHAWGLAAPSR